MLSRAFAGRVGPTLVFCLPGSNNAIRLAVDKLLLCELKHLVHHSRVRNWIAFRRRLISLIFVTTPIYLISARATLAPVFSRQSKKPTLTRFS